MTADTATFLLGVLPGVQVNGSSFTNLEPFVAGLREPPVNRWPNFLVHRGAPSIESVLELARAEAGIGVRAGFAFPIDVCLAVQKSRSERDAAETLRKLYHEILVDAPQEDLKTVEAWQWVEAACEAFMPGDATPRGVFAGDSAFEDREEGVDAIVSRLAARHHLVGAVTPTGVSTAEISRPRFSVELAGDRVAAVSLDPAFVILRLEDAFDSETVRLALSDTVARGSGIWVADVA